VSADPDVERPDAAPAEPPSVIVSAPFIPASACPGIAQITSYAPGSSDDRSSVSLSPAARSALAMSVPLTVRLWATDPALVTSSDPPAGTVSAAGFSANSLSSTVAEPVPAPAGAFDGSSSPPNTTATAAKISASTAMTTPKATAPEVWAPGGGGVRPSGTGDDPPSVEGGSEVCTGGSDL
jgi:hypothetical protein